jgi:hypothetical protein
MSTECRGNSTWTGIADDDPSARVPVRAADRCPRAAYPGGADVGERRGVAGEELRVGAGRDRHRIAGIDFDVAGVDEFAGSRLGVHRGAGHRDGEIAAGRTVVDDRALVDAGSVRAVRGGLRRRVARERAARNDVIRDRAAAVDRRAWVAAMSLLESPAPRTSAAGRAAPPVLIVLFKE